MNSRRKFIRNTALLSAFAVGGFRKNTLAAESPKITEKQLRKKPVVMSTWNWGLAANEEAWKILSLSDGRSLDAVEKGVMVSEADPNVDSVGYGGLPDRNGNVTLDACIMDEKGNCGSVAFLKNIMHPISVARMVMERTPHIMLAGEGALEFAISQGFKEENMVSPKAMEKWKKWKKENEEKEMPIDKKNHDTIGMLALDNFGNLSGACTTSGTAWKYHGRVGDSPIIGAGLYVDNDFGAACATGKGELVMKTCGSMLIVELMRNGKSPQEACEEAVRRIAQKQKNYKDYQVGFLALNKNGEHGSFSIKEGFTYAFASNEITNQLYKSNYAR